MMRSRSVSKASAPVTAPSKRKKLEEPRQAMPQDYNAAAAATLLTVLALKHGQDTLHDYPLGYEAAWPEEQLDEIAHDGFLAYEAACAWLEEFLDEFAHIGPLGYEAACAWLEEFPGELAHDGPLGNEAACAWLDEFLDELAHDGPWGYETLCAWLEEFLDEFAHDGPLDFDAACAWLESTTRTAALTTQSARAAAIPMVPEELRSDSR